MSVRRCQEEVDSREFAEWQAYRKVNPWGEERADWRSALLCSLVSNMFRGKGQKPIGVADFMYRSPEVKSHTESKSKDMKAQLTMWATLHNARVDKLERRKKDGGHRQRGNRPGRD